MHGVSSRLTFLLHKNPDGLQTYGQKVILACWSMVDWVWLVTIQLVEVAVSLDQAHVMKVDLIRHVRCSGLSRGSMALVDPRQGFVLLQCLSSL